MNGCSFQEWLAPWMAVLPLLAAAAGAQSPPIPWNHPDGTTHWYQARLVAAGVSWGNAQQAARQAGGHLATVTSPAENGLVFQLVNHAPFWTPRPDGTLGGPWLGAVQSTAAAGPAAGWRWLDATPLAYTNWSAGRPDDGLGSEDRLHFGGSNTRVPGWDDASGTTATLPGYVIEWSGHAPDHTVGLLKRTPASEDGFTLLSPSLGTGAIHLLAPDGRSVHDWSSTSPIGYSAYLLDDGDLLRSAFLGPAPVWQGIGVGGLAGKVERIGWNGTVEWSFVYDTGNAISHHDVEHLPGGNVLLIAWERRTAAEAIANGRDPALLVEGELWPDKIVEIAPTGPTSGTVVWEWRVWDHLVQDFDPSRANFGPVGTHPELIDINFTDTGEADWQHVNGIDYDPITDQILLSVRNFNEIWVIDHGTTTQQAAGHTGGNAGRGGDLLYRWGNPQAWRAGGPADQQLFGQHDAEWILPGRPGQGNITLFNNGDGRPSGAWSSVEEIVPPRLPSGNYVLLPGAPYGPAAPLWTYAAVNPTDVYSRFISGAQRLPGGNTLVCNGLGGTLFEVTPSGEIAWRYVNPLTGTGPLAQGAAAQANPVFRALRYMSGHPGLQGRSLVPVAAVETYPPQVAARFGSVNTGAGARTDVLRVNGNPGDVWRRAYAFNWDLVTISLDAPPLGGPGTHHTLHLRVGEPISTWLQTQPLGIGEATLPLPLLSGPPIPPQFVLTNTLGWAAFGSAVLPWVGTAPTTVLQAFLPPGTFTLQGLIADPGSPAFGISVTNAVVLQVF